MLEISTFGRLSIKCDGEPVACLATQEMEALLVYLACTSRTCPREALAGLLWEGQPQELALSNLSEVLSNLHRNLGEYISITRDTAGLNLGADVWLDVGEMEAKLSAGRIEEALELYKGPFLVGFCIRGAAAFGDWVTQERDRLYWMVVDALETLVADQLVCGNLREGIACATRLLDLDPSQEWPSWHAKLRGALHQADASAGDDRPSLTEAESWKLEREQALAERERLLANARAQAQRQAALLRLSAELGATLDEGEICRRVVNGLHDTLGYDVLALMLVDQATGERVLGASVGFEELSSRLRPGEGLSERPLLDGELHYTPDVTRDPRYIPGLGGAEGGGAEVDVPVSIGGEVLGVLIAERRGPHTFDQDDFEVLTAAAQQAGVAIGKARLLAAERKRADQLDALRITMADMTAELELPALLQSIVERAAGLLGATGGELGLYDEASQELRVVVSHNLGEDYVGTRHGVGEGAMGYAAKVRESLIIDDYQTWKGRLPQYARVHAVLAVPLEVAGRLVGVFTTATTDSARRFTPADLHLLDLFAQQAAVAIHNARLYDQAQQEIAERVRAEAELRQYQEHLEELVKERTADLQESEERYRSLFDGVPVGLYRTTPAGRIVDANLAQVQMLGYPTREDLLAIDPLRLYVDPKERMRWQALMKREGVVRDFEVRFRRYDNTVIWVNDTARAVNDEQGQVLYYEGSLEDVTERKQAEVRLQRYREHLEELVEERAAELRESEERYRTLFDGVPMGLYRTTPAGQLVDANPALVRMIGFPSREDLLAVTDMAAFYVDTEERKRWQSLIEREGIVHDFEFRHRRYDGTVIWVKDTARAVRNEQGEVMYYEGSMEDITQRRELEAEIRRQKDYYEALFLNSPVAVVTADLDGDIVSWNPMAEKLFGYTQEEVIGKRLNDFVANDDSLRAEANAYMDQVIEVGRVQATTRRTRRDGSLVDVDLLALPVVVAGQEVGFIVIYHDITERKRFEEEIRRQKDYFEALFVNSPVAVVTADRDGEVISWNPMARKLFGYTEAEAIGQNIDDLVARDDSIRAEAVGYTDEVANLGRVQVTTRRTRKDGSLVDVELLALPLVLAGERFGFYAMYHDISERRRIERELRRQKEYFEALFVNSPVAVVTADLEGDIVSWNPMAEKLFGYSAEEVIDKPLDDFVADDDSLRAEALEYTNQVVNVGRVQVITKRTRRDGSLVDVELLALPVVVSGKKVGFIVIYVDVTDLQEARRQAEAANQAKSAFLANMSHELRTPLNAILGYTQLMDRDPTLTIDQLEYLGIINRSGELLLALINDVLEMSKIEAGEATLQETSFDLYRQLDGLEEMFGLRAHEKGLSLTVTRDDNVPQYIVTDEGKLGQVLSNLLGNAVKFTHQGSVMLRVSAPPSAQLSEPERRILRFEVEDTGPGIAPEELPAIFDAFVQSEMGRSVREGTGLGLTISRQFVRLMGGDLTATSQLDQGSSFQFDIQVGLAPPEMAERWLAHRRRRVVGLASAQPTCRLLVAEDSDTNRKLLVKLLTPVGFEVLEATDGQEAIDAWERWGPDLIWMDMRMPVMDGYEATRRIKAMPGGQATFIIALTSSAFEEERERILSSGCDDFVRKPFREDEIFDMLTKHLGVRFVYNDMESILPAEVLVPPASQDADAELARRLAALPSEWLTSLQEATILGELGLIADLVDQIAKEDADLGEALAALAHKFEHERILTLIRRAGEEQ